MRKQHLKQTNNKTTTTHTVQIDSFSTLTLHIPEVMDITTVEGLLLKIRKIINATTGFTPVKRTQPYIKWSDQQLRDLKKLYQEGVSIQNIAPEIGVTYKQAYDKITQLKNSGLLSNSIKNVKVSK